MADIFDKLMPNTNAMTVQNSKPVNKIGFEPHVAPAAVDDFEPDSPITNGAHVFTEADFADPKSQNKGYVVLESEKNLQRADQHEWVGTAILCALVLLFLGVVWRWRKQIFCAKRLLQMVAVFFVISCVIPPWQYTVDANGKDGLHTHKPGPFSLVIDPPSPEQHGNNFGVRIDFSRLVLEWAALGTVLAGIIFSRKAVSKVTSQNPKL